MKKLLTFLVKTVASLCVILLFALILITTIKGCIVTVWISPQTAECYKASVFLDNSEAEIRIMLLPDNQAFFEVFATSERAPLYEISLTKIRAEYGIHIIGPLWKSHYAWDFMLAEDGYEPLFAEIETLKTLTIGEGKHILPREGSMKKSVVYLGENSLKFAGITLKKDRIEDWEIEEMFSMLDLTSEYRK
jgi:hypothetical protein